MVHELEHRGELYGVASRGECKVLVEGLESERHPDLAVYRTAPPVADAEVWRLWVPALVVEVVSPDSEVRDYQEKPEEYLRFGVQEYWVVDADRGEVLVLRRRSGVWAQRVVRPPEVLRCGVLPGLEVDVAAVFAAV